MNKLQINREGKIKLIFSLSAVCFSVYVSIVNKSLDAITAMTFSFIGDVCIMASRGALTGKKENTFNLGVMSFAFAHFIYVSAMGGRSIFILITMSSCIVIYGLINLKLKNDKLIYIPYTVSLLTSTINAWMYSVISGIGMILFLSSDGVLSIFEKKGIMYQIIIWVLYIPAQYLMLTALLLNH